MTSTHIPQADLDEAKLHLIIALEDMSHHGRKLPETHEELVERFRDYFENQKIDVFSKMIAANGEEEFRDFIAETVVESGLYIRDDEGQVKIKA